MDNALSTGGAEADMHMYVDDNTTARSGDIISYRFYQDTKLADIRVTLVWMDPPAWVGTMKPVLHDLDLTVEDPNGKVIQLSRVNVVGSTGGYTLRNMIISHS